MWELLDRLLQSIADVFFYIISTILGWLVSLIELIPVPEFLQNINPINFPEGISYYLEPLDLPYGIGIITSAYAARFLVRRLPFIG